MITTVVFMVAVVSLTAALACMLTSAYLQSRLYRGLQKKAARIAVNLLLLLLIIFAFYTLYAVRHNLY